MGQNSLIEKYLLHQQVWIHLHHQQVQIHLLQHFMGQKDKYFRWILNICPLNFQRTKILKYEFGDNSYMDRSGMQERRNLISKRCIKNKYFCWILNICPLNSSSWARDTMTTNSFCFSFLFFSFSLHTAFLAFSDSFFNFAASLRTFP